MFIIFFVPGTLKQVDYFLWNRRKRKNQEARAAAGERGSFKKLKKPKVTKPTSRKTKKEPGFDNEEKKQLREERRKRRRAILEAEARALSPLVENKPKEEVMEIEEIKVETFWPDDAGDDPEEHMDSEDNEDMEEEGNHEEELPQE